MFLNKKIKALIYLMCIILFYTLHTYASVTDNNDPQKFKGEIGEWQESSTLPEPLTNHYSFTALDKVCIFTGQTLSFSRGILFFSEIDDKGIKFWKKAPPLLYTLEEFGAVEKNGFLYIIGGKNMGMERGSVIYFPLNANGTIDKASTGPKLPEYLSKVTVVINNGYIFISGGKKGKDISNKVFSAHIGNDGMPEKWQELLPLPISVYDHNMFAYKDFIYISGGYHNAGSIYGAKIKSDGTIEKWIGLDDMPVSLEKHASVEYKDYVFVSGGISDGRPHTGVYAGKFSEDGLIITWKKLKNLPQSIFEHSMTVNDKFLIVSGGISGGRAQAKVLIAPLY